MDIVLHMLNGYLLASKAYLHCHLKETADFERQNQNVSSQGVSDSPEVTREELKNALLAAQDSAAVQILLEVCLPNSEEQQAGLNRESLLTSIRAPGPAESKEGSLEGRGGRKMEDAEVEGGLLSDLREVQCLICSLLHQMFIADPNIAKLVHFQVGQRKVAAGLEHQRGRCFHSAPHHGHPDWFPCLWELHSVENAAGKSFHLRSCSAPPG